jgi:hypothetical protein
VQGAIDQYIRRNPAGATDLSEMAQQSAGEALLSLACARTASLFTGSSTDARNAIRSLSTKTGFGKLGQRFFGRFVARFLNFYLSRATAATLGGRQMQDLGDIGQFNKALQVHCDQSARIVRDFCGEWYSKTEYQKGIDLGNASKFLAVAVKKLRSELAHQRTGTLSRPRLFVCSGAKVAAREPIAKETHRVELDCIGPNPNVHLLPERRQSLHRDLSPRLVDFLEIASYIFSADCATRKGTQWTDDESTEPWGPISERQ